MTDTPSAVVAAFLAANKDFDPLHDHVLPPETLPAATMMRAAAVSAKRTVAPAVADVPTDVASAVQGYQRALRVATGPASPEDDCAPKNALHPVAAALLDQGLDSAHKIAAHPEYAFVQAQADTLPGGEAQAKAVYANAQHIRTQSAHMFALVRDQVASPFSRATLFATGSEQAADAVQKVPGYDALFGSLDYCPCGHSDSILGPGAYFVDLMRITDAYITGPNSATIPPGHALKDRRPDLFDLPITAANSDNQVPFLSIVATVLERLIADTPDAAYRALAVSGFPFNLPFALPLARIRTNLAQLGTSLGALGQTLRPTERSAPYPLPPIGVAGEILGLGASECALFTQPSPLPQWLLEQCYGIDGHHPETLADLNGVPLFLQRTGLQRSDLDLLLNQNLSPAEIKASAAANFYINATGETGTSGALPPIAVSLDDASGKESLLNLTNLRLERISTFVRLSRALGWSFEELDWIIRHCGGTVDEAMLQMAGQMTAVAAALGETGPIAIAALFAEMKTSGQGPDPARTDFFDTIFNKPSILAGRDPYAQGSNVPFNPASAAPWAVGTRSGVDGEIRSRLGGALQVSDDDLTLIATWMVAQAGTTTQAEAVAQAETPTLKMDLPTLTILYRVARLSRLTNLGVSALLHLLGLLYSPDTDPMAPVAHSVAWDLDTLGAVADAAIWLNAQPFTVYELEWALHGRASTYFVPPDPITGLGDYIDSIALQAQSLRVKPGDLAIGTVTPDAAAAAWKALSDAGVLTKIGLVAAGTPDFVTVARTLPLTGTMLTTADIDPTSAATVLTALIDQKILTAVTLPDKSTGGFLPAPVAPDIKLDFLFVDAPNASQLRNEVRQALIAAGNNVSAAVTVIASAEKRQVAAAVGGLAARLNLGQEVTRALLPFASATLTDSALVPLLLTPLSGQPVPASLSAMILTLARTGLIASRLNLLPGELSAIIRNPAGFSVDNPLTLTLSDVRAITSFKKLALHFQDSGLVLANCIFSAQGGCKQTGFDALSAITAWPTDQIKALTQALWPDAPATLTVVKVDLLARCFALATRLGSDAWFLLRLNNSIGARVMTISATAPSGGDRAIGVLDPAVWEMLGALANATLDAVNAHFRDAEFATVAGTIEGILLVARRDALVGAVIWRLSGTPQSLDIQSPEDLYQFLLLDVEMGSCMSTSPIIQATAAVQVYMQRCRMGMEDGVTSFPFDPIWWDWMSSYRIWEVNRKIFLYPENYVDPSLRVQITPPFATLKQRLQQSDLTDTAVEDAYREYFNSVDTLGTLRMVDGYNVGDVDPGTGNRRTLLWLFARTGTEPYNYHFRTLKDGIVWSPWQKIDHTVPAPLATPVYAFQTPYLFWTEPSTTQGSNINNASSQALTSNRTTIRFIRRRPDGSWSPPQALISDIVVGYLVDYALDSYANAVAMPLNAKNLALNQSVWRKPIAIFTPASATIDPKMPKVDRLMATLGFSLPFTGGTPFAPVNAPSAVVPDQLAYDGALYRMYQRISTISAAVPSMIKGRVQFGGLQIVDAMANRALRALTLLDPLPSTSRTPVAPALDRSVGSFGFTITRNELASTFSYDNYAGQEAFGTVTPGTALLQAIDSQLASAVNVKNQLGWFLLDNADEAFLVQADGVDFPSLTELVSISEHQAPLPDGEDYLRINPITAGGDLTTANYRFVRLTTQTIPALAQRLSAVGLPGLLNIDAQLTPELDFARLSPTSRAIPPASATLDFKGAMGDYFREIFFHAPFLVAYALNASGRFDKAKLWLQYVFNPTAPVQSGLTRPTDRFWNYLPFRNLSSDDLAADLTDPAQISAFNDTPFDPDAIAGLRPSAYAKATVMKYISNVADWGDQLFRQFTRETVNEATNLYVMANDLLGPRPREVSGRKQPAPMSFADIKATAPGGLIPEFLIHVENLLPAAAANTPLMRALPFNDINSYFCIPENEEFAAYWDRIAAQLYKIRHCMNIDGQYQTLPLLSPPLDVRAVIAAAAAADGGLPLDFGSVAPVPAYRFEALLGRAKSLAGEVAQLGGQVQTALERQDAEQLEQIRNTHEKALLDLGTAVRTLNIDELQSTRLSLQTTLASANARYNFYDGLISKGLSDTEKLHLAMITVSQVLSTVGGALKTMAGAAHLVPNVGSPFAMTYGGKQIGSSLDSVGTFFETMANQAAFVGNIAQISAGYERRAEDWGQQRSQADFERQQIQQQIDANASQVAIAQQELAIHLKTIAQNGEIAAYLQGKFTSRDLYQWLVGRLGAVHYQTYTLAYDIARAVERSLQFELNSDQSYLQFGYWDNVHKGLTAGEGLQLALNRMEHAWVTGNTRTLEIRRTVALSQLDPLALARLRTTGSCQFALTERLFDYDHPGHYCRKIKTVSISIPAVVGPWQTINASLTQLSNQIVVKPDPIAINFLLGGDVATPGADTLRSNWCAYQQVALSTGLSDSGLFQLDFRDERYLPFEGTGAVSRWQLDMPLATNRFDFDSISDVIVEISYTALDGGVPLRTAVTGLPALGPFTGQALLSIADTQPDAWRLFMDNHSDTTAQALAFAVPSRLVPPHVDAAKLTRVTAILRTAGDATPPAAAFLDYQITPTLSTDQISVGGKPGLIFDPGWFAALALPQGQQPAMTAVAGAHEVVFTLAGVPDELKVDGFLDPTKVLDLILVLEFEGKVTW